MPIFNLSNAMSRKNLDKWLDDALEENGQTVMSVGSDGPVTDFIRTKKGIQLKTLDINADKNPDFLCDLTDMNVIEDNSFDCVVVLEVLEHVKDPQKALSEIWRVLKSGGKIILSTPFIFHIHAEPHDYWRFTHYGLSLLLEAFADVEIRERNGCAESWVVTLARMAKGWGKVRKREFIMVPFAAILWPFAILYDRLNPDNRSTSGYFVTANKPVANA
ncbi:MAG: methyltransferase domain-containing protein [Alphaproteobacteria bacterium]|nr:methyltransferase domain-containing protein [Alphaproteobacteria bacterium]